MQAKLAKFVPTSIAHILAGLWYAILMVLIIIFMSTGSSEVARYWGL